MDSASGQSVNAAPATTDPAQQPIIEPPLKGRTKLLCHNAAIMLTTMFSELDKNSMLADRSPTMRGEILTHILKARDGLVQLQDLLKED